MLFDVDFTGPLLIVSDFADGRKSSGEKSIIEGENSVIDREEAGLSVSEVLLKQPFPTCHCHGICVIHGL